MNDTNTNTHFYEQLLNEMGESTLDAIDPDTNFVNELNITDCKYYNEESFQDMIVDKYDPAHCLSLMHLNVRSIPRHFDDVMNYLDNINHSFDLLGISETWHNSATVDLYNIPGYQCVHKYRDDRRGGGVTLYIKDGLNFKIRHDLSDLGLNTDTVFIDIKGPHVEGSNNHSIIGLIYRPPNTDLNSFNNSIAVLLSKINSERKVCYLMGDYNIDLFKSECHQGTADFVNCMLSNSYYPLITKATRVCNNSATLIDNIFCSNVMVLKNTINGVLRTDISDHYAVFSIICQGLNTSSSNNKGLCRPITDKGKALFKLRIETVDWDYILKMNDVKRCYTEFSDAICKIYCDSFPLKNICKREKNKPWLSDALKQCIRIKNKLYVKYRKKPILHNEIKYKVYRNTLKKVLIQAEKQHYDVMFNACTGNSKQAWRILKNVLGTNKHNVVNTEFIVKDSLVSDKESIVNEFNKCFVNLGPNLAECITDKCNRNACDYMNHKNTHSIFVAPVDDKEVCTVLKGLKNKSSPGWDGLKTDVIKEVCHIIKKPLTHIINLSLQQGVVPDELKLARVVPIFKSGDAKDMTNYRPVSILPCLSKVFERVVYNRLIDFIDKHNILCESQFGFRKQHNTQLAVTLLVDKICKAMDKGNHFIGVFIDLSKAFDTVNHNILLSKLEHYGIRGTMLKWIEHYLSNRKQFVEYNCVKSDNENITCGVPQGSILGPLFFLLYINDLPNVSKLLSTIMFADDTNMFLEHHDIKYLESVINIEIVKIVEWLNVNKLSLNVKKTHAILFTKHRNICSEPMLNVYIGKDIVQTVTKTTFLGVVIDYKLTWKEHIHKLCNKISKGIGLIKKVRYKLQRKTLLNLYFTFIQPYLTYCNVVWGNAAQMHLKQLLVLQKRVLRIIYNAKYMESTKLLFEDSRIMNVCDLYFHSVCLFMYKHWKGMLPPYFKNFFEKRSNVQLCNTRGCNLYEMILCRTETHKKSIAYNGPYIFNLLLKSKIIDVQCVNSISFFKRLLRKCIQELVTMYNR